MTENNINFSTKVKLNNGAEMPILGLGTWQLNGGKETEETVFNALLAGYRLIDTAEIYRNEESVGKALYKSGIPRAEGFITTKLWNSEHGYESAMNKPWKPFITNCGML